MEIDMEVPECKRVNIIMITNLLRRRYVRKAFELGCTAYAGKPINVNKFEKALKKLELI